MSNKILTQSRLRELVTYDPETGIMTRNTTAYGYNKGDICGVIGPDKYVRLSVDRMRTTLHRMAWFYVHGVWPKFIDHIDRDPSNNKLSNLREVTRSQNMQNVGMYRSNKSGFMGVRQDNKRWHAQIFSNGKNINLGRFDTAEAASAAYQSAKTKFHIATPMVP